MHIAARMPYAEVEAEHAARAELDGRLTGRMHRTVGRDREIRFEQVAVLAHEVGDVLTADLLLAFEQQDDIAGQAAINLEKRLDRQDLREVLALVVGDTARENAAVADRRLERR